MVIELTVFVGFTPASQLLESNSSPQLFLLHWVEFRALDHPYWLPSVEQHSLNIKLISRDGTLNMRPLVLISPSFYLPVLFLKSFVSEDSIRILQSIGNESPITVVRIITRLPDFLCMWYHPIRSGTLVVRHHRMTSNSMRKTSRSLRHQRGYSFQLCNENTTLGRLACSRSRVHAKPSSYIPRSPEHFTCLKLPGAIIDSVRCSSSCDKSRA